MIENIILKSFPHATGVMQALKEGKVLLPTF